MTFLNKFHKEMTERKIQKIIASQESPMSPVDVASYMKRNFDLSMKMEAENKRKQMRSLMLDIVIAVINEKTGGGTKYINRQIGRAHV